MTSADFFNKQFVAIFIALILPKSTIAQNLDLDLSIFENIYNFSDGLARIKQNGKYGYIDKSGKIVILPQFDETSDFSDGMAVIKKNDKYGYIDKNGSIIIQPQFEYAAGFSESLAMIKQNGKIMI